jgi:hypothetical protein
MKSGSNPGPADDDDFTSAAESLLGIDLSSSGLSGAPIDLDDADLFGEPDVVEPETVEAPAPTPDETQEFRAPTSASRLIDDEDDFGSDFGAGIVGDEEPPPRTERRAAPPRQERPAPRAEERPTRNSEERPARRSEERPAPRAEERAPVSEEPPPEAAPAPRKDDTYWDALEGWDWSDETSGAGKGAPKEEAPPARGRSDRSRGRSSEGSRGRSSEGSRGRSGDRPSRRSEEPAPERPRQRPAAESFGDDFGSGLEEKSTQRRDEPSPDASIFSLHPSESQARYLDDRDEDAEPSPDVSIFGLNPTESQVRHIDDRGAPPHRSKAPPPRADFDEGDDFGSGLEEESGSRREYRSEQEGSETGRQSSEGEQRRGRRRRGRGRGQGGQERGRSEQSRPPVESRQDEPEVREDLSFDETFDEPPRREAPAEEPEPQESRFQDVPTWSEAVSLLVKQRPRTTSSGSGERGRSESSSSESGDRGERGRGERGGNGGRGRGRGRRGGGGGGGRRSS